MPVRWAAQVAVGALPGLIIVFTIMLLASGSLRTGNPGTSAASIVPLLSASTLVDSAAFHRANLPAASVVDQISFRSPGSVVNSGSRKRILTVVKKTSPLAVNFQAPRENWNHLNVECRKDIDTGVSGKNTWQRVVLHGSGSSHGSAKLIDRYHSQIRGMKQGLDYHFIIGNGNGAADGSIKAGPRWLNAMPAEGMPLSESSISVCFVGDFQAQQPTSAQLAALDELLDYLSIKLGQLAVTTHSGLAGESTRCLGAKFPADQVLKALSK